MKQPTYPVCGPVLNRIAIGEGSPERKLWQAVLAQAVMNDPPDMLRRWLASRDGRMVCALAGVDHEWATREFGDGQARVREAA
jgi:hypothetical protein